MRTTPDDDTLPCSDADRAAGDSPIGSGTAFSTFMLLDYRAPWSRTAAADVVRDVLSPAAQHVIADTAQLRVFATRPVRDRHSTDPLPPRVGRVGHDGLLAALAALPDEREMTRIATGTPTGADALSPTIGICTNGKRDRCCAVRGRPVATELAPEFGAHVTEISHLGGHRFAATMLVLPTGYSYGLLAPDSAREVVRLALDGLVSPHHLRGRADLSAPEQAADAYWRARLGAVPLDDVRITATSSHTPEDTVESTGKGSRTNRDRRTGKGAQRAEYTVQAIVQRTVDSVRVRYEPGDTITVTTCSGKPIKTGQWVVRPH